MDGIFVNPSTQYNEKSLKINLEESLIKIKQNIHQT